MPALGDITVTLGIDSQKWFDEASKIGRSANTLGSQLQSSLGGRGSFASTIGDMGKALSAGQSGGPSAAFKSLADAALGSLNAIGPWGVAFGAVGGILADQLIPKLVESGTAAEKMAGSIESAVRASEKLASESGALGSRLVGVDKIKSPAAMREFISDIKVDETFAARARDDMLSTLGEKYKMAVAEGILKPATHPTGDLRTDLPMSAPAEYGGIKDLFMFRYGEINPAAAAVKDELLKGLGTVAEMDAAAMRTRMVRERGEREVPDLINAEARRRKGEANMDRIVREAQSSLRIAEEVGSIKASDPMLSSIRRAEQISSLVDRGLLEQDVGSRALRNIREDYARSVAPPTRPANDAIIGGTAEGFRTIQESFREQRGDSSARTEAAREAVATLKRIEAKINAAPAPVGLR